MLDKFGQAIIVTITGDRYLILAKAEPLSVGIGLLEGRIKQITQSDRAYLT